MNSLILLLGEWYDVGRTTYIWGPDTWTSQQWNFVQGEDGTVVALFNGMWSVAMNMDRRFKTDSRLLYYLIRE